MTAPTSAANRTRTRTRPARPEEPEALEAATAPLETERRGASSRGRRTRQPSLAALETAPSRGRTRTRPAEPADLETAPDLAPDTERRSARPRTAAAERAYARRAQREGRAPERAAAPADSAAGRASFVVLIIALLVVGVATTLWLSTQAIADSYRLDEAKQTANDLSERAAVLQREVTKMDSPSEIARRAKELGMVLPDDPARLVVQPDGTVVVVGEPKQAEGPPPPPQPAEAPAAEAPPADTAQAPAGDQGAPAQRAG